MLRYRWFIGYVLILAVTGAAAFWIFTQRALIVGRWANTTLYRGATPGSLVLQIAPDGAVQITPVTGTDIWWADGRHDLRRQGNAIEIRSGQEVVGEFKIKRSGGKLSLLDRSYPVSLAVFLRTEPTN